MRKRTNVNGMSYLNALIILMISILLSVLFSSCASFQKVSLKDYSSIESIEFQHTNTAAYEGVEVTIPQEWLFLPPVKDNQILRFISPDAKKTGVLEIFVEETPQTDKEDDNGKEDGEDNGESNDNNDNGDVDNESNDNDNDTTKNDEENKEGDNTNLRLILSSEVEMTEPLRLCSDYSIGNAQASIIDLTQYQKDGENDNGDENDETNGNGKTNENDEEDNNDDGEDGNDKTDETDDDDGEEGNDKTDETGDDDEEDDKKEEIIRLKPLSEYLTDLLEEKKEAKYRMGWYVKRFDDKAKGYLSKIVDKEGDFIYYAFFIDEREPRRIIRLVMFETNEDKPSVSGGANASFSVPKEDVNAVDKELFAIFKSVSITPDRGAVSKSRYNIGLTIEIDWKPYFDDTQDNILFFLHKTKKSAIQIRKIGYKYSENKEELIEAFIRAYQNENTDYTYEEEVINIGGIECSVLKIIGYTSEYFNNTPLTLKKIFIPYNDEIYEAGLIYNDADAELSDNIEIISKNIHLIGEQ
jgi:hypothetical protein